MKTMKQYVVDAFTDKVFAGNPAAVCVMDSWLSDTLMQKIAIENNLSETAFAVREGGHYHLRWFTPGGEVELCGHATLATAYVIFRFYEPESAEVEFDTLSGVLRVKRDGELLTMDFPSYELKPLEVSDEIARAVGIKPVKAYMGADMVLVLNSEDEVRRAVPDLELIRSLDGVCLHVTATGRDFDCVTRSFAPKCNVAEDPVCGRGHCHVVPLWAQELKKNELRAYQASPRGGVLHCRYMGARTILSGNAALFSGAQIYIDE